MKRTRKTPPTLADVARMAGVGKATVSRVINGGKKVSPETLRRIQNVMRELDYRPSQAARSLKGNGTKAIGLILPSIADPFFARCAEAAQAVVQSRGYLMIVTATNYDAQTEINELEALIRHRVEGILLAPGNGKSKRLVSLIGGLDIPVITLNHPLESAHVPSIVCDNRGGARIATEHLLEHGCRRIICLGGDSRLYTIRERQRGYSAALRSSGLEPMLEEEASLRISTGIAHVTDANTYAEVEAILRKLCFPKKRIDAIFAVRNFITIFAFEALQNMGLRIPEDVALIGFDDFDLASALRPAVTVIRQPVEEIGSSAAELLFRELKNRATKNGSRRALLGTELVIRNSCGCAGVSASPTALI